MKQNSSKRLTQRTPRKQRKKKIQDLWEHQASWDSCKSRSGSPSPKRRSVSPNMNSSQLSQLNTKCKEIYKETMNDNPGVYSSILSQERIQVAQRRAEYSNLVREQSKPSLKDLKESKKKKVKHLDFKLFHQMRDESARLIQSHWKEYMNRKHTTAAAQKQFYHEVAQKVVKLDPIRKHLFLYTCYLIASKIKQISYNRFYDKMEKWKNKEAQAVIDKINVLFDQDDPLEDDDLLEALRKKAHNMLPKTPRSINSTKASYQTISPSQFAQTTMLRLSEQTAQSNRKIEYKRSEKLLSEYASMKQSPTISPNSRMATKNRTQGFREPLRRPQKSPDYLGYSFQPQQTQKHKRTFYEFYQQKQKWLAQKQKDQDEYEAKKLKREVEQNKSKPSLTQASQRIIEKIRSATPKMSRVKDSNPNAYYTPEPTFRPVIYHSRSGSSQNKNSSRSSSPLNKNVFKRLSAQNSDEKIRSITPNTTRRGDYLVNTATGTAVEKPSMET